MKIYPKTNEPRLEIGKELLRFVPMLKANDSVVRVAHDDHVAAGASLPPLVDPLIIDMMEVNVRQERADDRALRRPFFRLDHASIFEHACRQPFGNQPDDSAVANPMLDETDQPIPADLVEKGLNVTIEHPVDPPLPDPERERIQCLMLVALRSEPVAETQELRLIDRRQDCHHCSLDDLVLYGRDAERSLSMYFRRDGSARYAPVWTRACRSMRFASRCSAYSVHVISSTPGAADFFKPKKLARKTSTVR